VKGARPNCGGFFTFSMVQRVGGHFDGIWSPPPPHPSLVSYSAFSMVQRFGGHLKAHDMPTMPLNVLAVCGATTARGSA